MFHITLHNDSSPVVHAPFKCTIAKHPLMQEKLYEILGKDILVPVTKPTERVSSLI